MRNSFDKILPDGTLKRYTYILSNYESLHKCYPRHYKYVLPMFAKEQRLHREVPLNPFLEDNSTQQPSVVYGLILIPQLEEFCDDNQFDMFAYKIRSFDSESRRDVYVDWVIDGFKLSNILRAYEAPHLISSISQATAHAAKSIIQNVTRGLLGLSVLTTAKSKTLYDRHKASEVKKAKDFFVKLLSQFGYRFIAVFRSPLRLSFS